MTQKFGVNIIERQSLKTISVEANSPEEAEENARTRYFSYKDDLFQYDTPKTEFVVI